MKARVAICASGTGTNFESIVSAARAGCLCAEVVGLIVNRESAGAVERAKRLQIPYQVISPKAFATRDEWDLAMAQQLAAWRIEWVVLAGYLVLIGPQVLAAFPGKIVNSHPSLLPKFGGPGMYGDKVHTAVLNAQESETGLTIHLIDGAYDRGRIVAQKKIAVLPGDTSATLAERVKAVEVVLYPKVINDLILAGTTIS